MPTFLIAFIQAVKAAALYVSAKAMITYTALKTTALYYTSQAGAYISVKMALVSIPTFITGVIVMALGGYALHRIHHHFSKQPDASKVPAGEVKPQSVLERMKSFKGNVTQSLTTFHKTSVIVSYIPFLNEGNDIYEQRESGRVESQARMEERVVRTQADVDRAQKNLEVENNNLAALVKTFETACDQYLTRTQTDIEEAQCPENTDESSVHIRTKYTKYCASKSSKAYDAQMHWLHELAHSLGSHPDRPPRRTDDFETYKSLFMGCYHAHQALSSYMQKGHQTRMRAAVTEANTAHTSSMQTVVNEIKKKNTPGLTNNHQ